MSHINDFSKELNKIVALVILSTPFYGKDTTRILLIKRPSDDEWAPNKYSPPCGHIKDEDIKYLKTFPQKTRTREHLYIRAGLREFKEEIRRDPSFVQLKYVGDYYDDNTGYDIVVLTGHMTPSSIKNVYKLGEKKTKIRPTSEAVETVWRSVEDVGKLMEKNEIAGVRAIEMALYCV